MRIQWTRGNSVGSLWRKMLSNSSVKCPAMAMGTGPGKRRNGGSEALNSAIAVLFPIWDAAPLSWQSASVGTESNASCRAVVMAVPFLFAGLFGGTEDGRFCRTGTTWLPAEGGRSLAPAPSAPPVRSGSLPGVVEPSAAGGDWRERGSRSSAPCGILGEAHAGEIFG